MLQLKPQRPRRPNNLRDQASRRHQKLFVFLNLLVVRTMRMTWHDGRTFKWIFELGCTMGTLCLNKIYIELSCMVQILFLLFLVNLMRCNSDANNCTVSWQVFFEENLFDCFDRWQSEMALKFGDSWFSCTCPRRNLGLYRCCQPSWTSPTSPPRTGHFWIRFLVLSVYALSMCVPLELTWMTT